MYIDEWATWIGQVNKDNGWRDRYKDLVDAADDEGIRDHLLAKLALIDSEVAEAMEIIRTDDLATFNQVTVVNGKQEGIPTELADIIIRTLDLAGMLGIDNLMSVMVEKVTYNSKRGYKHGKKA